MVVLKGCMVDFIVSCLFTHFESGWMLGRCYFQDGHTQE